MKSKVGVILAALALAGCSQIDTGNVGVVKTGGQYKTEELQPDRQRAIAQGEADSARIKAEGLRTAQGAEYLKLLQIQNEAEAIKKWDGKLPTTMAGNSQAFIPLGGK